VSPDHPMYVFNQVSFFAEGFETRPIARFGMASPLQELACDPSRAIGVRVRTDAVGALCNFYSTFLTEN
jgi:hypothetical protein